MNDEEIATRLATAMGWTTKVWCEKKVWFDNMPGCIASNVISPYTTPVDRQRPRSPLSVAAPPHRNPPALYLSRGRPILLQFISPGGDAQSPIRGHPFSPPTFTPG